MKYYKNDLVENFIVMTGDFFLNGLFFYSAVLYVSSISEIYVHLEVVIGGKRVAGLSIESTNFLDVSNSIYSSFTFLNVKEV